MPLAPGCCLSAWHALSPHLALQYAWGFWRAYRASPRWITNGRVFVKHTAATFPPSPDAAVCLVEIGPFQKTDWGKQWTPKSWMSSSSSSREFSSNITNLNYSHSPTESKSRGIKDSNSANFQCYVIPNVKITHTKTGKGLQIKSALPRNNICIFFTSKDKKKTTELLCITYKDTSSDGFLEAIIHGQKGHHWDINWIPICAFSRQISLLGQPCAHAKYRDSAWVSCSNKITVVLSFISSMTPTTCTFRRPRWVQVIDEEQMVFQRCDERHIAAERTAPQDCVGWMLSALSLLALQRWLRCAHPSAFLIPTAIQVSSEGWGSSLKP